MFFFSGGSGSGEWRFHIHMSIAYWDLNNSKSGLAKKGQSISAAFQLILKAESVQESSQSKGVLTVTCTFPAVTCTFPALCLLVLIFPTPPLQCFYLFNHH